MDNIKDINTYCKYFRQYVMNLTLEEFSIKIRKLFKETVSPSSISSFENGRSSNLKYISYYYKLLDETNQQHFKKTLPL